MKKDNLKITIRTPKTTDADALVSMVNSLVKEKAYISLQKKITRKEETKYLKDLLKDIKANKKISYVLDINGQVMGTSGIIKNDTLIMGHIGDIGILLRKEVRGMGLGEKLFRKVIDDGLKKFKFKIVRLYVFADNKPAIGLYKKLGFETVGTIKKGGMYFGKLKDLSIMIKYIK